MDGKSKVFKIYTLLCANTLSDNRVTSQHPWLSLFYIIKISDLERKVEASEAYVHFYTFITFSQLKIRASEQWNRELERTGKSGGLAVKGMPQFPERKEAYKNPRDNSIGYGLPDQLRT